MESDEPDVFGAALRDGRVKKVDGRLVVTRPGSITTDPDWNEKYNAACDELERARAQYDRAESLLAVATSGLNRAHTEVSRLFKKRMSDLEAASSADKR